MGLTTGGLKSKSPVMVNALGHQIQMVSTTRNGSDDIGVQAIMEVLAQADWLLADQGRDADCSRNGRWK